MRNIQQLRELLPIQNLMNTHQLADNGEYDDWDEYLNWKENLLVHRDMKATIEFHNLDLEEKEELLLLAQKPYLWDAKMGDLGNTPIQQLDLFDDLEEDHDKKTKH